MQCVINRLLSCPLVSLFCVWGAALRYHARKVSKPPSPKGVIPPRVAAPDTLPDLLGARAERVPDCSSYLSRIPWSATDSGLSIHPRNFRGSPSGKPFSAPARASPRLIKRQRCQRVDRRWLASSNASAATDLKAFSQGIADAERFENASSKFRWNPSPLLPLM